MFRAQRCSQFGLSSFGHFKRKGAGFQQCGWAGLSWCGLLARLFVAFIAPSKTSSTSFTKILQM